MVKKIKILMDGITIFEENNEELFNLKSTFKGITLSRIPYEIFRKGIVTLLKKL
jgi:hypothetical protein